MGQMGFMVMTCGLGAFAAAAFHLVGHGMYKASLFLGSGGAVRRAVRHAKAPPAQVAPGDRRYAALVAGMVGAIAVGGATALLYADDPGTGGGAALLIFAWATASLAAYGWLCRHRSAPGTLVAVASLGAGGFAYVGLLAAATGFLAPALAPAAAAASPWLLAPVLLALALGSVVRLAPARMAAAQRTLYVLALGAGQVVARPARGALRAGPAAAVAPPGVLARTAEARS
jgi:NADH:ubiquinone oxidoreductase subunit 5 (subunit L)/multisubunit Na+/H+ antiporter MnhA subunit